VIINIVCLGWIYVNSSNVFAFENNFLNDSLNALGKIYVGKILIAGNETTDEDIITREIFTKEDSKLNTETLQEDVQRIYKTGLFTKVDVYPVPTDSLNKMNILFLVEEKFYIIPVPQGGFRNGEFSKFWAGLNISWQNFRGRNETLSTSFGLGYEPFVNFGYAVPWIGKQHYFASVSLRFAKNYNQSLVALNDTVNNSIPPSDSNYKNYNFNTFLSFGKYFGEKISATSTLGYNSVRVTKYEPGRTVTPDGIDEYLTLTISGKFDTRNSLEYTLSGSYYFLQYTKFGFGKLFDFNRVNMEAKKFIPIKIKGDYSITFASYALGIISFGGTIPSYLHEFYGYGKIIRGYKKIVFEGENQFGSFNEFRIPIIDPFYVKGKSVPGVKSVSMLKKLSYKFGLYGTLFFDIGAVWYKTSDFFKTDFNHGFGAGLNFILPFGMVGRTDFAFRREGKKFFPQIIFDLDAAF